MGRSVVNLDADMLEINEHAQAIADAVKQKEQRSAATQTLSDHNVDAESVDGENVAARLPNEARPPPKLEVVDLKEEVDSPASNDKSKRNRLKSKHSRSLPQSGSMPSSNNDPWVASSVKMRNSKKHRFHLLSRTRELEGLAPFRKQDLLDEALDYLFEKYSAD